MRHLLFLTTVLLAPLLSAQHIGYLIPSGGQPGKTVEILVGGQHLWGIKSVHISKSKGISVESVTPVPGLPTISGKQRKFVTDWMRNVAAGKKEVPQKPPSEEIEKDWRKHKYFDTVDQLSPLQFHLLAVHLFVPRNPLQMSPAINSNVIVKLKIEPDAEPGWRQIRLVRGNFTVTNPLPFCIDPLPAVREPYLPVPPQKRQKYQFDLPAAIDGQIMPGETDIWHFTAKKDEKLVFRTFARALVPFMGDCVPGYFQCILELRDSRNRRIAYADDNGFDPDPTLCCTIPEDGEYALHVRDALYRGRADFIYRIHAFRGHPEFKITPPDLKLPRRKNPGPGGTVKMEFPVLIEGRMEKKGQRDQFVIHAEKGEKIVGEVFARRIGSNFDSSLAVLGPDGKQIAFNDDFKRVLAGPLLQHTDSFLCFTAPKSGKYTFRLFDTAGNCSENHFYFLRIDRPKPSFNLYVTPSAKAVFINCATPLKIQVEPLDGFSGDIRLKVKAPHQYALIGSAIIPAGTRETVITVTCKDRQRHPVRAELVAEHELARTPGSAGCSCGAGCSCCSGCACGRKLIRGRVFYGDEDTQAFAYTHVLLSPEWILSKIPGPAGSYLVMLQDPKQTRLTIPGGKSAKLKLKRRKMPPGSAVEFTVRDAPEGLKLTQTDVKELKNGWADIILTFHADANIKPRRFNLPVTVRYSYQTKPDKAGKVFRRKSEFMLPALLFEITGD